MPYSSPGEASHRWSMYPHGDAYGRGDELISVNLKDEMLRFGDVQPGRK